MYLQECVSGLKLSSLPAEDKPSRGDGASGGAGDPPGEGAEDGPGRGDDGLSFHHSIDLRAVKSVSCEPDGWRSSRLSESKLFSNCGKK